VAKLVGVDADQIAYYLIALLASLLPLFSVTMMLTAGHSGQRAVVTDAPIVSVALKGVDRSTAAKRGWARSVSRSVSSMPGAQLSVTG
jgi:hypothetical protein